MYGFSIGSVLADVGAVLRARWAVLLAVVTAAVLIEQFVFQSAMGPMALLSAAAGGYGLAVMGLSRILLEAFYLGFVIHLTLSTPEPARPSIAAAARATLGAFPALLLIGFVVWLPRALAQGPAAVAYTGGDAEGEVNMAAFWVDVVIGLFEGLLAAYLLAARPAAVWEQLRAAEAVRRGFTLTAGKGWMAAALYVIGMTPALLLWVAAWAAYLMQYRYAAPDWFDDALIWLDWPARTAGAVFFALCYLELRRLHDGPALETAEVFE